MSKRTNESVLDQIDTRAFDGSGSSAADAMREAGRQMSQMGGTLEGLSNAARIARGGASELDELLRAEMKRRADRRRELTRYFLFYLGFVIALAVVLIPLY